jgi:FAD/FMN-containing dehydrogenase
VRAALQVAAEHGVPVIARGGGTSQNGQPIGDGLVLDFSRHFNDLIALDAEAQTAEVRPGMVLERLNTRLREHGLFFPVEPSTATRCTIGGMTGNNSCGARSLPTARWSTTCWRSMRCCTTADGLRLRPASRGRGGGRPVRTGCSHSRKPSAPRLRAKFPKVQRRVGGYNLDSLLLPQPNLAQLLVGSEGTLALTTRIELKLSRLPRTG